MVVEIFGDEFYLGVVSSEDSYLFGSHSLFHQISDVVGEEREVSLLEIVGLTYQCYVDITLILVVGQHLLLHITIGFMQLLSTHSVEFLHPCLLCLSHESEEGVVESYDIGGRAVVGRERLDANLPIDKFPVDAVEQSPVARSPSVDALFYIAHDEVGSILSAHALFEQHLEVVPLYATGILKLIDHDMVESCANLLEDER